MVRIPTAIVLGLLGLTPVSAQQAKAPSDNELRSAYCWSLLNQEIPWYRDQVVAKADAPPPKLPWADSNRQKSKELLQAEAEEARATEKGRAMAHEELAKLQSAKNRLDGYVLPQVRAATDITGIAIAMSRGDADWQAFMAQAKAASAGPAGQSPTAPHVDEALVARIRACADPNWLPF
jgi:hypothetical protein